jgi:hypothetical protein
MCEPCDTGSPRRSEGFVCKRLIKEGLPGVTGREWGGQHAKQRLTSSEVLASAWSCRRLGVQSRPQSLSQHNTEAGLSCFWSKVHKGCIGRTGTQALLLLLMQAKWLQPGGNPSKEVTGVGWERWNKTGQALISPLWYHSNVSLHGCKMATATSNIHLFTTISKDKER